MRPRHGEEKLGEVLPSHQGRRACSDRIVTQKTCCFTREHVALFWVVVQDTEDIPRLDFRSVVLATNHIVAQFSHAMSELSPCFGIQGSDRAGYHGGARDNIVSRTGVELRGRRDSRMHRINIPRHDGLQPLNDGARRRHRVNARMRHVSTQADCCPLAVAQDIDDADACETFKDFVAQCP